MAPPQLPEYVQDPPDVELDAMVATVAADTFRQERASEGVDKDALEAELEQNPPPARLSRLTEITALRVAKAFRSLGIADRSSCSHSALASLAAALEDEPRGDHAQRGAQQQQAQQQRQQQKLPAPQGQQQRPQHQSSLQALQQQEPIRSWTGLAKQIQSGLREQSESLRGESWPCMKLFLTGQCDMGTGCKTCSNVNGLKGRGSQPARVAAAKRLGVVLKANPLSPDLAKQVADGEKARA